MEGSETQFMIGFQRPKRLACETETLTTRFGKFYAQPFERGFGTTIGNSLRRALLSSIEGAAITAVKIEGVLHEFSSIPGIVEDATDIILNLKRIPFRLHGVGPKTLRVERRVPGEVLSGEIEADAEVEILDPNIHIATVSEGGIWNRLVGNPPFWAARGPPLESRRSCNNRASVKEDELSRESAHWNILGSISMFCRYSVIVATIVPTFFCLRIGAVATISNLNGSLIPSTCLKSEVST